MPVKGRSRAFGDSAHLVHGHGITHLDEASFGVSSVEVHGGIDEAEDCLRKGNSCGVAFIFRIPRSLQSGSVLF